MGKVIELSEIIEIIDQSLGIDLKKVTKMGTRNVVDARRIYSLLAKKYTFSYYVKIGKEISRDHASITHYIKTCENLRMVNRPFNRKFIECENILKKAV